MGSDGIQNDDESTATEPTELNPADQAVELKPVQVDNTWSMKPEVEAQRERDERSGIPIRRLGVTWKDLTVKAVAADASIKENMLSQFNIPRLIREARHKPPLVSILDNVSGCVKPGEMLLVLGRPGSGCTTLLKMLANLRAGYASVTGDVHYGSMEAKEAKKYRSHIIMNTEEELFYPTLTVGQTMDFATRMKIPFKLPTGVTSKEDLHRETRDFLLRSMHIQHTPNTKVGNEYVRGVSGGERKRVSIIECLASRGSVFCWDNSTRGLDASTALDYTKAVRAMTDVLGLASIVTLYQAGNGIYDLFDKVLVLDGGKEIFYGTKDEARPFIEDLGFICGDGANVADFLTGVTVPTERKIRPEFQRTFPRNAQDVRERYEASPIYPRMMAECDHHTSEMAKEDTRLFQEAVSTEKHKSLPNSSALTVSFGHQVLACIVRQYQILWGDKATLAITQISTLIQALVAGSLFYNAPDTSAGLFIKSAALFFSIMFNSLLSMSEVTRSFTGRPILTKHKAFAFYHPAAFCIAQIAADIPVTIFQLTHFGLVVYWMVGLKHTAAGFFTYWIISIATAMCMTAMFRAIGAAFGSFNNASKVSGLVITAAVMYTGFMIQYHQMKPWFIWLYWLNPFAYAFDSLLSNEFKGAIIPCVGGNLIPSGPGYDDPNHQSCAGVGGAIQGETSVSGENYLNALGYDPQNIWRNFGVLWGWWAAYVIITVFFTSLWKSSAESGQSLLIPRENSKHVLKAQPQDDEAQQGSADSTDVEGHSDGFVKDEGNGDLVRNTSIFTWKNLTYTVKTPTGDRVLLDNVEGWVKPGMLGALMGSSGAGKTTLLDVLAQRKTDGTINGSILVDGRPLPLSFQRSAGYCEQLDVHEPYATVREALEFSALLRQSRETPRTEKLKYVDTIINLLELHDLADTLIGTVGNGLSVEQRKRVTIGVELVSKPSILIFLDEPTSGLDGQSAYNTVRFLRKLADAGQAILVTIHQPSAQLFAEFDTLLLLSRGGKTVYFGDIGENGRTVTNYFGKNGMPCSPGVNPAEHMIDVVSGQNPKGVDWNRVWLESPEHEAVANELDRMIADAAAKPPGTLDDGHEFSLPLMSQIKIVTHRMNVSLWRNTEYLDNKIFMHISKGLFNGFSFWMIGDSVNDLQLSLFSVFQFVFVAPGVIAQLQPVFIGRRDIFEAREKKSKMYSWVAFTTGLIVSEIPWLCICAVTYFACWYYTVGFPKDSNRSGATFFVMLMYEFIYTGIGQSIAAYAPNAVFASLVNPLIIGTLVSFCGVLVPYGMITPFWRYWMYYLNPFNYLMGSMLVFTTWGAEVNCKDSEFAIFDPPRGNTCQEYLADYMRGAGSATNLINPDATEDCRVCMYSSGEDYLRTMNLNEYYYGWRDAGIVVIFVLSSYACVFGLMKLRTKASKKAE